MRRRFGFGLAGAAAAAVAGLVAAAALAAGSGKVTTIAIAAPAKANDYGWNQMGVMAAKAVGEAIRAKVLVHDGIWSETTEAVLRRLAESGASFVITQA